MSIITSASGKSVYRGYEFFVADKVLSYNKINDFLNTKVLSKVRRKCRIWYI